MTVAFDAHAAATANTGGGIATQSWTHTPVGTPAGVVVLVQIEDTGTTATTVTGVTYGGVAMVQHSSSPNVGGESPGQTQYIFTLFDSIPTGPQTVVTSYSNSAGNGRNSRSVTLTGATTLEVHASAVLDAGLTANPKINVACTHDSVVLGMLNSGQDAIASVAVDANTSTIGGAVGVDVGATQHCFARKTLNTSSTDGPGWTATSEDALMYAVAIAEVVGGAPTWHPKTTVFTLA